MLQIMASVLPSLVSGLFGLRKPKAQGIDYKKLRDDAQAAGFNPLTALMAGGGAGYQRDFNPSLASGAFVGEALQRGLDTYFNTPSAADREAERLRVQFEQEAANQRQVNASLPRQFGYALTQAQPYLPEVEDYGPALNDFGGRPPVHPLDRSQKFIPVRHPDGSRGELDATIARSLDIKPFDTISAGNWAEIVGEVGEVETALMSNEVRDTAIRKPLMFEPGYTTAEAKRKKREDAERAAEARADAPARRKRERAAVYERIRRGVKPPAFPSWYRAN